jgi:Mg2+/Co2+ transporter CorB
LDDIHIGALCVALVVLIGCSAFFSGSETGLMTINRYRLRHRAKAGDKAAQRTSRLLERPDRLIGLILLGNNFVNILASSLATIIAIYFLGEAGIVASTIAMTLIVLVFGEVAPKTLAALHPERIAYPASAILTPMLKFLYPLVWLTNLVVNSPAAAVPGHDPVRRQPTVTQRRGITNGGAGGRGHDPQAPPGHVAEYSRAGGNHGRGHHGAA